MKDIVKEIMEFEEKGENKKRLSYFYQETMISSEYLNEQVIRKYQNLVFIKINMMKGEREYGLCDSTYVTTNYSFWGFIDKYILEYLSSDLLIREAKGDKIIDLTSYSWQKQIELRNRILRGCPIILALNEIVRKDDEYYNNIRNRKYINIINTKLNNNISIYPNNYKIEDYELLNSTKFILISNSNQITQSELDNFCLDILRKLSQENKKVIDNEKAIYVNISRKLKTNEPLNQEEFRIIENFINGETNKIEKENTILIRSKTRSR